MEKVLKCFNYPHARPTPEAKLAARVYRIVTSSMLRQGHRAIAISFEVVRFIKSYVGGSGGCAPPTPHPSCKKRKKNWGHQIDSETIFGPIQCFSEARQWNTNGVSFPIRLAYQPKAMQARLAKLVVPTKIKDNWSSSHLNSTVHSSSVLVNCTWFPCLLKKSCQAPIYAEVAGIHKGACEENW